MKKLTLLFLLINAVCGAQTSYVTDGSARAGAYDIHTVPGSLSFDSLSGMFWAGSFIDPLDSLFLLTDKPAGIHEDLPLELGTVIRSAKPGRITHLKFYSVDPGKYTVSVWSITGSPLISMSVQATTGWQRIQLATPFEVAAGDQYIVSYLTNQKFGYSKLLPNRSVGNITQLDTRYSYGHKMPATPTTDGYFVDVVFKETAVRKPLIVNAGRDTTYRLPKDSMVSLNAVVTGDSAYFSWFLVDSAGTCQITGMQTLNPVIKTKEPCTVVMLLIGQDKYGSYLAAPVQIDILPDLKSVLSVIEYYLDGTYRVITGENYFLMKNRTQ
jgi:hypothetical protein